MNLDFLKVWVAFIIIVITINIKHVESGNDNEFINDTGYCLAALVNFEMRGKGIKLFPVPYNKCALCEKMKVFSKTPQELEKNKHISRGKRSYKNFISKLLWGAYPNFSNASRAKYLARYGVNEDEGFENTRAARVFDWPDVECPLKEMKTTEATVDETTLDTTTPIHTLKSKCSRRRGKFKNYLNKLLHVKGKQIPITENPSMINLLDTNTDNECMPRKKVLVVSIPNFMDELPVVVVKDPTNQILSLSVQVADNTPETYNFQTPELKSGLETNFMPVPPVIKSPQISLMENQVPSKDSANCKKFSSYYLPTRPDMLKDKILPNRLIQNTKLYPSHLPAGNLVFPMINKVQPMINKVQPISWKTYNPKTGKFIPIKEQLFGNNQTNFGFGLPNKLEQGLQEQEIRIGENSQLSNMIDPFKTDGELDLLRLKNNQMPKVAQDKINAMIINQIHKILEADKANIVTYLKNNFENL